MLQVNNGVWLPLQAVMQDMAFEISRETKGDAVRLGIVQARFIAKSNGNDTCKCILKARLDGAFWRQCQVQLLFTREGICKFTRGIEVTAR